MVQYATYASIQEIRDFTGISTTEFADAAVTAMINAMTGVIERRTGRYWRSQKTVTDKLYDGDGSTIMYLHHIDVQSLTAISVDNNYTGTFTTITTSKVKLHGTYGKLTLATELNPDKLTFVIVFINMLVLWMSWFALCSLDIYKIHPNGIVRLLGVLLSSMGIIVFLTVPFAKPAKDDCPNATASAVESRYNDGIS